MYVLLQLHRSYMRQPCMEKAANELHICDRRIVKVVGTAKYL